MNRSSKGSHQFIYRYVGGRRVTSTIVLGRKEVPKRILRSVLTDLEITADEFRTHLR